MKYVTCPLCQNESSPLAVVAGRIFNQCAVCEGIFLQASFFVDVRTEEGVYRRHNNDVNDVRYQSFTSPIWKSILADFTPLDKGLDFGSGTGPVISKMIQDQGYHVVQYDPFFANHPELLNNTYDYIFACEVAEHFKAPQQEFSRLRNMLNPAGKLYLMTHVYSRDDCGPFENWYYVKDPTHVFIYTPLTFEWIRDEFGFAGVTIQDRLITFSTT